VHAYYLWSTFVALTPEKYEMASFLASIVHISLNFLALIIYNSIYNVVSEIIILKACACVSSPAYTRKNAQVVTNLQQTCSNAVPTTCQQDVFALLVPSLLTSCQQLVENLLQGC
jgi:hypothetical protein